MAVTGWRDDGRRYGRITRLLHWAMAAIFLWQFTGMGLRLLLGRTPLVTVFVGSHAAVGALLFALVAVRILWRAVNRERHPPYEHGLLGVLARAGHAALYALMVIVPGLGLLRAWGSGRGFQPFGIPVFSATGEQIPWAMAPANALHGMLAWALLALIAGHVFMALVHQFILRDGVARRMIGGGNAAR